LSLSPLPALLTVDLNISVDSHTCVELYRYRTACQCCLRITAQDDVSLCPLQQHSCDERLLGEGDKGSCAHVQAWPGDAPAMSDAAFEQQLRKFMEPISGERRLTCVSRQRIPEDLAHGPRAQDWAGMIDTSPCHVYERADA
jgi:hypothetical protein